MYNVALDNGNPTAFYIEESQCKKPIIKSLNSIQINSVICVDASSVFPCIIQQKFFGPQVHIHSSH